MTDRGTREVVKAVGQKLLTINGIVALLGGAALIIGLFVGSLVGQIICAVVLLGAATYLFLDWRKSKHYYQAVSEDNEEDSYSQHTEYSMKKLLFDDYQSSGGGKFLVKEVQEEETVKPSTKSAQPVTLAQKEEPVRELEMSDFFDLDSDIFRHETEPRNEFNFLLNKTLIALKDVLFAHSVAFFWANRDKGKMVLEAKATDSRDFMTEKRFPIENDVVGQVAKTGKAQLIGRLNPVSEKELVPYYTSAEYVSSILAVPVYFSKGSKDQLPVGVISADSKAEDAFGSETLRLLGHFTKLVSAMITSYTNKYDLLLDSELLSSIRRLQDRIKSDPSEVTILNSLAEEANRLVNWDYLTVALYGDEQRGWVLQKVVNKIGQEYVTPDQIVDFNNSIVGRVIKTNTVEVIDDLSVQESIRFDSTEKIDFSGSFLCVPISSYIRCYGALTLESNNKSNFTGSEVETMYRLVENAASALEVLYVNDLVKDFVVVDHLTGSFNKKHFLKQLEEEVQRADDLGTELALVSIAIDEMKELIDHYGKEGFDSILHQVVRIVRTNLRPYDVVGRQDADRMGVLLINTAASEAYLWAEKIRNQIASYIITLYGKSFSVTVSAGVCGLTESMRKDELIAILGGLD
jgi:diguanylate cyclase (GGDEF)-like protein